MQANDPARRERYALVSRADVVVPVGRRKDILHPDVRRDGQRHVGGRQPSQHAFEALGFGVERSPENKTVRVVGKANYQTHTIKRWIPSYKVHSFRSREDGAWQVDGNFLVHDGPDNPMVQLYATAGCIEVCRPAGFVAFNNFMVTLAGSQKPDLPSQLLDIGKSGCMTITYERATKPPLEVSR